MVKGDPVAAFRLHRRKHRVIRDAGRDEALSATPPSLRQTAFRAGSQARESGPDGILPQTLLSTLLSRGRLKRENDSS